MKTWSLNLWFTMIAAVLTIVALAGLGMTYSAGQSAPSAADASETADETYTWSAELIAFDAASNTVTVKAMLVPNPEKNDLVALRAGDDAVLTWSGLRTAAGVRAIERGNTSSFDRLTMPIEFVASELDGRYVSFKVPIPAQDAAAIARLSPGTYVTATSPLRAKNAGDAVTAIRPFNDLSSAAGQS